MNQVSTRLSIGQRLPLNKLNIYDAEPITFKFTRLSPIEIGISCFALDPSGKLISDDYMVFYNQPKSPCGHIKLNHYQSEHSADKVIQAEFEVHLSTLNTQIDSLYFVLSADKPLNQVQSLDIDIYQQTQKAQAVYQATDFANNQACMLIRLYRKSGVWRLANVGQGFDGGLASIVKHFGGEVDNNYNNNYDNDNHQPNQTSLATQPIHQAHTKPKVSLEKVMLQKAPKLVNLAKKATVSLEKRHLQKLTAKVALVLDASGSMHQQYKQGRVQKVVNRLLPLAVSFDDDQALDCWAFGEKPCYLGDVGLQNYEGFIDSVQGGLRDWPLGARTNNEAAVMEMVTDFYKQDRLNIPAYILFISDGGVANSKGITKIITEAAKLPFFWQFVGLGGRNYGILENLDEMTGRVVDNCNFFALDDLDDMSEEELYENLLEEFPAWLKKAIDKGIIQDI
ncbi:VWA domain-containing protein [Psychrobacter sp.]|uniref:VWA domain-containing protein n=1 Tax=Psychrobacter sp. TaxID=56811 RepID=UPI0025E5D1C4|nr:VWA domain-containing protein [Psychrobacter sp.]